MRRLLILIALLAVSGVVVGPCRVLAASSATEAEALLRGGIELRRRGEDARALDQFQRAYVVQRSARALAQIGFAEQALGRWHDAEEHLGQALADTDDPWIRKNRATLERSRATVAAHLGSLEVLGGPDGAELRVDGRIVGTLPLARPVRVAAGSLGIEVRAEGYLPTSRPVDITAGQLTRETISLQRIDAVRPPPIVDYAAPPPKLTSAARQAGAGAAAGWRRPAAWVSGGAAALFAGGAVAAFIARGHYAGLVTDRLRDQRCLQKGDLFSGSGAGACAAFAADRDDARTLGLVSAGLAGVFALGSTILFVTAPRGEAGVGVGADRRFACAPVAGGTFVQCGGHF